jgi:hypothetical protein
MGVLAAGVGEMHADMRLEGALVRREPGVAIYPEERTPVGRGSATKCGLSLCRCGPKLLMNISAGSRTTFSYRALFLANHSRLLWRLSWRKKSNSSGRKKAVSGM